VVNSDKLSNQTNAEALDLFGGGKGVVFFCGDKQQ